MRGFCLFVLHCSSLFFTQQMKGQLIVSRKAPCPAYVPQPFVYYLTNFSIHSAHHCFHKWTKTTRREVNNANIHTHTHSPKNPTVEKLRQTGAQIIDTETHTHKHTQNKFAFVSLVLICFSVCSRRSVNDQRATWTPIDSLTPNVPERTNSQPGQTKLRGEN